MTPKHALPLLLTLAILGLASCGGSEGDGFVGCPPVFLYGLTVHVRDSVTGTAVSGATLTLREGTYTEVMEELPPGTYVGAGGRPGTYHVTVEAPGYRDHERSGIVVTSDECNVVPGELHILLDTA